ncbi:MAG: type IV toxin-antitoxin system AbiEi family antitoxin domain-containing protein [Candidatus Caldatribacteriota bacterium]|nr:type IV toxin-antitoxin system AbiEi family antitoxin domain-containing protein [Candidatus Caldatribacteriota bacterium]
MRNEKKERIKEIFYANHGYSSTGDISSAGIDRKYLKDLVNEGNIERIKRGLYRWKDAKFDVEEELINVSKIIPHGIICLESALSYYKLTTYTPGEYTVAVHRKYNTKLPDYPPIKLYYFSDKYYIDGVEKIDINGHIIKMYNVEKTICDCLRYEDKISKDIIVESIKEYVRRRDKNISKLMNYAAKAKVKNAVQKYIEVLV